MLFRSMLIIGDKEIEQNLVNVRKRGLQETENISLSEFIIKAKKEIEDKV